MTKQTHSNLSRRERQIMDIIYKRAQATAMEMMENLPDPPVLEPRLVALGKTLFSEARLSRDASVSCASCHDLASGGADRRRFSIEEGA